MDAALFPTQLPPRAWYEFPAAGFSKPAAGFLYRGSEPKVCGLPLGGIDTGCLAWKPLACWATARFST